MSDTCKLCGCQIFTEGEVWIDNTGGDVCGVDGTNNPHVPANGCDFEVQGDYGHGWELVTTERSWHWTVRAKRLGAALVLLSMVGLLFAAAIYGQHRQDDWRCQHGQAEAC